MQIYNSMTRKKETLVPIHEGKVGIYACGPTVYNFFHIGNARPFITFDVLRRQLEREGYEVTFVLNFVDVVLVRNWYRHLLTVAVNWEQKTFFWKCGKTMQWLKKPMPVLDLRR